MLQRHRSDEAVGPQARYMHATTGVSMPLSDEGPSGSTKVAADAHAAARARPHAGAQAQCSFKHATLQSTAQRVVELRSANSTEPLAPTVHVPLGSTMHAAGDAASAPLWCAPAGLIIVSRACMTAF